MNSYFGLQKDVDPLLNFEWYVSRIKYGAFCKKLIFSILYKI